MIMASTISWFLYNWFLVPYNLGYLKIIVFILAIAALVQFLEMFMKKEMPSIHKAMGVFLPLITTNCAIMGISLINVQKEYSLFNATVNAISTAAGYTIALVVFSCIRERLEDSKLPASMENLPIALITASCMAISLMGLAGMH